MVAETDGMKRLEARLRAERFMPLWALLALLAPLACGTPPPNPSSSGHSQAPLGPVSFSGVRASQNLETLVDAGARGPGSESAARAGAWIAEELEGLGARVEVWAGESAGSGSERAPIQAVVGILDGESDDPLLLIARYDTLPSERDGRGPEDYAAAAGAAVVLELGRVLAEAPRPYSVALVFLEGDGLAGGTAAAQVGPGEVTPRRFPGSHAAATELAARQMIDQVRLAIFFGRLPGPRFVLERDLRSHRMYRETLWQAGRALEAGPVFAGSDAFSSPLAGHLAFLAAGLRPTVGLIGTRRGGPGAASSGPAGPPDPGELATLGRVTLEAIDRISRRLGRIDAFAKSPLGGGGGAGKAGLGNSDSSPKAAGSGREPVDAWEWVPLGP